MTPGRSVKRSPRRAGRLLAAAVFALTYVVVAPAHGGPVPPNRNICLAAVDPPTL